MSVFSVAVGCTHRPADLAEWTPADHHHQAESGAKAVRSRHLGQTGTYTQPSNRNLVAEVTWLKQCASCHGKRGRGDGPNAAMFKPRDLGKLDWQDSVKDEEIAKVIKEGRNKMPAFNLPDSTINDLVAHVRTFGAGERAKGAQAGTAGQAPAAETEEEAENGEAAKEKEAAPREKSGAAPTEAKKEAPPANAARTADEPGAGK